jgi:hypothetical protein
MRRGENGSRRAFSTMNLLAATTRIAIDSVLGFYRRRMRDGASRTVASTLLRAQVGEWDVNV